MATGKRTQVRLRSTESAYCYYTTKNKSKSTGRLQFRKYDPIVRRHVIFKEAK
ncbi:MAG TPA: 50S ribosomal protein L33 [Acidobacteriota bacterium]|nr:50S ribosomal protein L33 [Acidobacteriota bacterium]HMZ82379.1 50S ribosomal protein L33 [Acidobacteriota bacterium]HNB70747.1 50S ribosomal protein L33 [Acidobacteriota bacterium]HND18189.1 50S ribosomal protein L33 [Acidobacteriota bacterium]HNG91578.1 50S ribosomal protein L33 [Acidobacteriota bacterium]